MPETATKERPMLFSGAMVRAILADEKTQTRRVVKPQPHEVTPRAGTAPGLIRLRPDDPCLSTWDDACPYGTPGDRLWVRETLTQSGGCVQYAADNETTRILWPPLWRDPRPSIHMPRRYSRILLEVTDVRVEWLQAISAKDANAEGMRPRLTFGEEMKGSVECFRELWDSINGTRGFGWAVNPWVWCISFKRLEAPHA